MNETMSPPPMTEEGTTLGHSRECTRCEGEQHLIDEIAGMGKYVCDTCKMRVGFDLEADPVEFLSFRGYPAYYTKDVFGKRLSKDEHRL